MTKPVRIADLKPGDRFYFNKDGQRHYRELLDPKHIIDKNGVVTTLSPTQTKQMRCWRVVI